MDFFLRGLVGGEVYAMRSSRVQYFCDAICTNRTIGAIISRADAKSTSTGRSGYNTVYFPPWCQGVSEQPLVHNVIFHVYKQKL